MSLGSLGPIGALLVGFILGGLSGAVIALLFAPQSGEETRALIKDKSIELRDKAQVSAEEAIARAEAAAAEALSRADELGKQLLERAPKAKKSNGTSEPQAEQTPAAM